MSHTPIVQKLVDYLDENPGIQQDFELSFKAAMDCNLKRLREYNIETLGDYINYMDQYVNWIPTENNTGRNVVQHIAMFYFIIDLPPINKCQDSIHPPIKSPYSWFSRWLIDYAKAMGAWMDTPESITKESIASFYTAPNYHMQDYPVPEGGWKTFNEFFARHIDPAVRPIATDTSDEVVIVSAADCKFDNVWAINEDTVKPEVTFKDPTITTKGIPWSIPQLLDDTIHAPRFAGGIFTHSFLEPSDYHRQHAPVSGKVIEAKVVPGLCYLEVVCKELPKDGYNHIRLLRPMCSSPADRPKRDLSLPNKPGYQFLQARGVIVIDSPDLGLVAVLPIGMAQVSSIKLSVKPGDVVKKGDELSYFQFGGSDVVMVFQKDANVTFHQEHDKHYNFGERVATAPKKAAADKTT